MNATMTELEHRTVEIGKDLFARAAAEEARFGSAEWFDERMMSLTMRDEMVKVQLFRFVDVLPALRSPREINRHLREYFTEVREHLPAVLRGAVSWIPDDGAVGGLIAKAARFNANRLARRFIAGTDIDETIATLIRLRRQNLGFTIDLLGEAVLSEVEAEQYQRSYLHFIDGITTRAKGWAEVPLIDQDHAGPIPAVNVSVKLSSLYSQFDPIDPKGTSRAVRERLRPILRLAKERGAFVNIDMEQSAYKDVTLRIFEEVFGEEEFRDWADVGIAVQAYLRSCGEDLERLTRFVERRGRPVWVRLVKGAYWDYETVIAAQQNWRVSVYTEKAETDANYERQTEYLLERHAALRPAIASHNVRSIAHALALAEKLKLPERSIEFQMLYGMADPIKQALVQRGQRVRIYTPFGQLLPGMAYLVRRLLENTSNQSFLRAGFLEHVPVERLLMNPVQLIRSKRDAKGHERGATEIAAFRNEALADFSVEANRVALQRHLGEARRHLGASHPLVIDGEARRSEKTLDSINPANPSEVVGRVARATVGDATEAIAAAKRAFPAWRDTAPERRAGLLFKSAEVLRRRRFELAAWEVLECGKQWREADADVAEAIDFCDYYGREMLRLADPQRRHVPGEENETFYEPRGVAVVIAPWNFPIAILCGMTVAALVTGNTAIMKPAEQSSVVAAKLMEVFVEAGFPAGVVNFLPGVGEEIGPTLVSHPDAAVIAFTGSLPVGISINKSAAEVAPGQEHIKRVVTELGGKNAIIVDDDADLDEAVHGVAASAFGYAGQKCSACSRVVVLESIYDAFVARLVEVTRSMKVGPAEDPGNFVGPVIDQEAHQRILRYIETGKRESRLVYPLNPQDRALNPSAGYFIEPHVFADVSPTATIAQEEIFGPVLAAMRARDLTEALAIANGTKYALTGGLYSRSPATIERVRREFRVGNLYINRKITGALVDRQPFGGFKLSGIGSKAGGADYLLQFMVPRTITENTLRRGFAPEVMDVTAGTSGGVGGL